MEGLNPVNGIFLLLAQDAASTNWQYGIASVVLVAVGGALVALGRWGAMSLKELAVIALKEFLIPLRDRFVAFLVKLEGLLEGQSKDIATLKSDVAEVKQDVSAVKQDVADLRRDQSDTDATSGA